MGESGKKEAQKSEGGGRRGQNLKKEVCGFC
jgi:hypothetical protein